MSDTPIVTNLHRCDSPSACTICMAYSAAARRPASEPPSDTVDAEWYEARGLVKPEQGQRLPTRREFGDLIRQIALDAGGRNASVAQPLAEQCAQYIDAIYAELSTLAALRAEVERAVLECNAAVKLINQKVRERDAARAEVERLSAALQFYAEPTNWHSHPVTRDLWKYFPPSPVAQDCGAVAKLALAPPAEGPGR